jgi:protein-disulfide isomerase
MYIDIMNRMEESTEQSSSGGSGSYFLPVSILIAGVLIAGSVLYSSIGSGDLSGSDGAARVGQQAPDQGGKVDVSVDDDAILGDKDAPVTIVEFSDYQCPFCRRFWKDTLPQLKAEYIDTGKARLVYRDLPLSFHPAAQISAEAAQCAGDQDQYWQYHDKLFEEQDKQGGGTVQYGAEELKKWALEIGLNVVTFNSCLDSGKYKSEVEKDTADGSIAGATGTPSFFINGRRLIGAQPFAAFKAIIDEELQQN